jgi:hypothetical protein
LTLAEQIEKVLRQHFGKCGDPHFDFEDEDFKAAATALVALLNGSVRPEAEE